ncbi:hypothetical protein [Clostridium sp. C2-6-12]|uniref:hypothetical protein n=1 Tax=Clostridium sp. C2-6-12 TaxID=2698832 RepID=UPI00136DAD53|nr:hypothetical protein [Clostridium sp. C2-6-12]
MKKLKFLKFISIIFINYFILRLISFFISHFYSYTLKDTAFLLGLIVFIIELFINISGNSLGLSLSSLGQVNSQYVSNIDFKAYEHEDIKNKPEVNIKKLLNSALLFSSIFILITAYYL